MKQLETDRLVLREWQLDDFESYAAMCADPEVMRFLSIDGKAMSRFDAWRSFAGVVGHWHLRGFGMFAVVERANGEVIGRVGPWEPEGWPGFEIGWSLRSEYWGKGYAAEAARTCLAYAFTDLGRSHVISVIAPENVRSISVAERIGERLEGEVTLPHIPDQRILKYGLSREDWAVRPK